jgi:hypothetical protein
MRRRPIGQILLEQQAISEANLEAALTEQERSGRRLGEILIESGHTSWLAIARAMAEQVLDIEAPRAEPEPPAPPPPAPSPFADTELKLHSVEAMLRERQRAFVELVGTAETLRSKVAWLEDQLEERNKELARLRLRIA